MPVNLRTLIRTWFREHEDDGEFLCAARDSPYSVLGCVSGGGRIVLTTKPAVVSGIFHEYGSTDKLGMIGRYGLPDEADLSWMRKLIGRRSVCFLGDMDPVDLLVFAWLRAGLRPKSVVHLGMNDTFLRALRIRATKSLCIPLAPSEQDTMRHLDNLIPEWRALAGLKCVNMLEHGKKLELEIVLMNRRKSAAELKAIL